MRNLHLGIVDLDSFGGLPHRFRLEGVLWDGSTVSGSSVRMDVLEPATANVVYAEREETQPCRVRARVLSRKATPTSRLDPRAFSTTCLETSKHLQVTQQAVSLIEKRVFKKLRHCLSQCEREGLFDREDPEAGRIFLRVFSDALRDVRASKNAILIRPI